MIREAGVIESVYNEPQGSLLAADGTTGDGSVLVDDITDYTEAGGTVLLPDGSTTADYTALDADTGRITLAGTLPFDVSAGDPIRVWDPQQGAVATELRARVNTGGRLGNDDALNCDLDSAVALQLTTGPRDDGKGERVNIADADGNGQWTVTKVRGKQPQITNNRNQYDRLTVTYTADAATWVSVNPPPAWDSIDDQHGSSIEIDGGSSGIRMKQPGVYAINGSVFVSGIEAADPATSVRLELVAGTGSYPDVMWAGCGLRGGDASGLGTVASCGLTYWRSGNDAQSLIFAYINTANLDLVAISSIVVTVAVQRII